MTAPEPAAPGDFVRDTIRRDIEENTFGGRVQTRFPPEPNGYLHIGHAKAITVDFSVARDFDGVCNLRLDDTNPDTEESAYVEPIIEDVEWLGFAVPRPIKHTSDYFAQLYEWAELLVTRGLAYVDDQDIETISAQRGGFGKPGVESPYRDRSIEENLDLLRRMKAGEFEENSRALRAKIDMQSPDMSLRDPVMYRIRKVEHFRTGATWSIYPTYDWAHGQSDAIEGVTHSLCTLEFETHRPLYNWYLAQLPLPGDTPRQIEFARLELTYTVTSKRKLRQLVADGVVEGWDDPRLPTLRGLRRRGYPAAAIREFCSYIGITKTNSRHDIELLESFVRKHLNLTAQRRMAVLRPVKLVCTNWPCDEMGAPLIEHFEVANNPENPADGTRRVPFTGELYIEADDFAEDPPPKFFRLSPGREVRLRGAYFVTATDVLKDEHDNIVQINAVYDPESKGGHSPDGRKVKSTMHWVSAMHAKPAKVALYDRLFTDPVPGSRTGDPMDDLNPASCEMVDAMAELSLEDAALGEVVQFERLGYFAQDTQNRMHFHRTVGLRDEWANIQKRSAGARKEG